MACNGQFSCCCATVNPERLVFLSAEFARHVAAGFNARVKEFNTPLMRLALFFDPAHKDVADTSTSYKDLLTMVCCQ